MQTFMHCNGNPITAVSLITTGPTPGYHEILEIAILPLDHDLSILKTIPYHLVLKPDYPERIDRDWVRKTGYIAVLEKQGMCPVDATILLEDWKSKLGLRHMKFSGAEKLLMPLVYHAERTIPFLQEWLGHEYETTFHEQVRDIGPVALYLNDRAGMEANPTVPFPKHNFTYLCNKYKIVDYDYNRQPLTRVQMLARLYHQLCFNRYVL